MQVWDLHSELQSVSGQHCLACLQCLSAKTQGDRQRGSPSCSLFFFFLLFSQTPTTSPLYSDQTALLAQTGRARPRLRTRPPERLALPSRQREALMGSEQRRTLIPLGVVLEMNWTGDQLSLLLSQNLKPRLRSRRRHTGATCR